MASWQALRLPLLVSVLAFWLQAGAAGREVARSKSAPTAPAPSAAAPAEHGGAHAEHGGHAGPKLHGAPPRSLLPGKGTEFLAINLPLFLWTLIVFLVVTFLLGRLVWRPVIHAMEAREHKMAEGLTEAENIRAEARRLMEQHDEQMAAAHDRAKQLLEAARADATRASETFLAQARVNAAKAREQAEAEIESAKTAALAELRRSASQLAAEMAGKVVAKPFAADQARPWIEESRS